MSDRISEETRRSGEIVGRVENLVLAKGGYRSGERTDPLMGYWSLVLEFHRAILCLILNKFYGAACALLRPTIEAVVRAHLVISAPDRTLKMVLDDEYRTNLGEVGQEIDTAFGMDGFLGNFLTSTKDMLHGYTHVGMHQLGRRFTGKDLVPNYQEDEVIELIHLGTKAVFMVNWIVTRHLGLKEESEETEKLLEEWSKQVV
jgi:hypothetical protein